MGYIFISLMVFGAALFLYLRTNAKINSINEGGLTEDMKREMDSLITEFNRTAARNIELLEDRIQQMEQKIQKADKRLLRLDEMIERAKRPIVVEKIVEKKVTVKPKPERKKQLQRTKAPEIPISSTEIKPSVVREKAPIVENDKVALTRTERLKKLIREGKSREELMEMGFLENEINLLRFLIKRE